MADCVVERSVLENESEKTGNRKKQGGFMEEVTIFGRNIIEISGKGASSTSVQDEVIFHPDAKV